MVQLGVLYHHYSQRVYGLKISSWRLILFDNIDLIYRSNEKKKKHLLLQVWVKALFVGLPHLPQMVQAYSVKGFIVDQIMYSYSICDSMFTRELLELYEPTVCQITWDSECKHWASCSETAGRISGTAKKAGLSCCLPVKGASERLQPPESLI